MLMKGAQSQTDDRQAWSDGIGGGFAVQSKERGVDRAAFECGVNMPVFVVRYEHPDDDGWQQQLLPHIHYLQDLLAEKVLLASGPLPNATIKSAMLIIVAANKDALSAIIADDPFAEHGLIENMTVTEWDPIFGAFNDQSSMLGAMQSR